VVKVVSVKTMAKESGLGLLTLALSAEAEELSELEDDALVPEQDCQTQAVRAVTNSKFIFFILFLD